ncbi:MAG: Hpt domain-containing protein [Nannocystaceae bacterium]|nr:Hpt domain-containing protein [Myxococcales bacterium]
MERLRAGYRAALPGKLDRIEALCSTVGTPRAASLPAAIYEAGQVKGTAGTIGFNEVAQAMEALERALIAYREGGLTWEDIVASLATARAAIDP